MFKKTGDSPVVEVKKVCPKCTSVLIAIDASFCDSCKLALNSNIDENDKIGETDVHKDCDCGHNGCK